LLSELFGVDEGDGAGAGVVGVAAFPAPVLGSLVFVDSLLSEGFVSLDDSDELSELFGA
jgi:hypothetical protein